MTCKSSEITRRFRGPGSFTKRRRRWQARRYRPWTRDASILWEAHRAGIDREYCQIEKLHNLGALPGATGFTVSCLPVKVAGASAGWCRAAAIVDDQDPNPPHGS